MVKYKIVALGKMKENYYKQAIDEYAKRMSRFARLEIVEIDEVVLANEQRQSDIDKALQREAQEIIPKLEGMVIALDIDGKLVDSVDIARTLEQATQQYSTVTFVIGSSNGLADSIKQRANARWSFGRITMPHRLARVVLAEQLYRACTIRNNVAYHK